MDAEQLARACRAATAWPLPRSGRTLDRWRSLASAGAADLVLGRLVEAHADAVAILAELGGRPVGAAERWGVWAASAPGIHLTWSDGRLDGTKPWCSGATLFTHALVTADDGTLLAVDLAASRPGPDDWAAPGMRDADTRAVSFAGARAEVVGRPGAYLDRPGFWVGGIGVAAVWWGGAVAVAEPLRRKGSRSTDPHLLAHLGAVERALAGTRDALRAAAVEVDDDPDGDHERLARRVRSSVADACAEVIGRTTRALGPAPYATDSIWAALVADLEVYVRQDHAERDLEVLGRLATDGGWSL